MKHYLCMTPTSRALVYILLQMAAFRWPALVSEAFSSLFVMFRTLKHPQSLRGYLNILKPNDAAKLL